MNILKRELRAGFKPFLFWTVGLFVLVFLGTVKYEGISSAGADMAGVLASFPRVVLALLGMVGVDVTTLGGYTAVLTYYALICAAVYSVHLGSSAVARESADRTYEFLFTKPRGRPHIIAMKLIAAWLYLALFCALYAAFSLAAVSSLKAAEDVSPAIALFSLSMFLVGSLFVSSAAFLAAEARRADRGFLYGNLAFLYAFLSGAVCDMLEDAGALRLISPLKYFPAPEILMRRLDPAYAILAALLSAAFLFGAFRLFCKKDLT